MGLMSLFSLQNYAEWHYTRYFPSIQVLREKILKKSQDEDMTDTVMNTLQPLFVEKNIIESRVHEYISQGKTRYFIRQKLSQKKFDTLLVEESLSQVKDLLHDPETYRKVIENRCKKAHIKGFSRKKILYELQ
jgi:SOS response regulatory protein OraA/RecX